MGFYFIISPALGVAGTSKADVLRVSHIDMHFTTATGAHRALFDKLGRPVGYKLPVAYQAKIALFAVLDSPVAV